jgi:hypothetical protein
MALHATTEPHGTHGNVAIKRLLSGTRAQHPSWSRGSDGSII